MAVLESASLALATAPAAPAVALIVPALPLPPKAEPALPPDEPVLPDRPAPPPIAPLVAALPPLGLAPSPPEFRMPPVLDSTPPLDPPQLTHSAMPTLLDQEATARSMARAYYAPRQWGMLAVSLSTRSDGPRLPSLDFSC
jgi:hypothetical protein